MKESEPEAGWVHFPHDADIGVRGFGPSKNIAFEQAALAMTAVTTDPKNVNPLERVHVSCEAPNDELLFVDWLNTLVFEMATRRMLFSRFDVHIKSSSLHASIWGENIETSRHRPAVEVKGATYTNLLVQRGTNGTWVVQCIVDV